MKPMHLSAYNTYFHSEGTGYFLYNALSNILIELSKENYDDILSQNTEKIGLANKRLEQDLIDHDVLVQPGREENILLNHQYQRNLICFQSSMLELIICPTLACNFSCSYCFEADRSGSSMTSAVEQGLVDWIKTQTHVQSLDLTWYGGEPLIAFERIRSLTEKLDNLDIAFHGAALVTNGYLLDEQKITALNELKIQSIQITLDGPSAVHDKRRSRAGGGTTFDRVLNNLDMLLNSDYQGNCSIRVNIDRINAKHFPALRHDLLSRFHGKRLRVHPARIINNIGSQHDHQACMSIDEWARFSLTNHHEHLIPLPDGPYPRRSGAGICSAKRANSFVVGPQGELYKCWVDVGDEDKIVGRVGDDNLPSKPELIAQYSLAADAYHDPRCRECRVLPICGGGCLVKRRGGQLARKQHVESCSVYKDHLTQYLEAYIKTLKKREICSAVFRPGETRGMPAGYRILSPKNSS